MMHPSISVNTLCIGAGPLAEHVERVARLGAAAISPTLEQVEEVGPDMAARLLADAGLRVATLTHRAFGFASAEEVRVEQARLDRSIDIAATIGAQSITMTTGGRGDLGWRDAANRFAGAIAPCATRARAAGVMLSPETTSHLYADASIAHRLADLVELSVLGQVNLGIDIFACWFDSDIEAAIAAAAPRAAVVQVADYVAGDRGLPCRAVPGDGMIPLGRLIPLMTGAGYDGWFDLEIIGPRIMAEGPEQAIARAATRLGAILSGTVAPT